MRSARWWAAGQGRLSLCQILGQNWWWVWEKNRNQQRGQKRRGHWGQKSTHRKPQKDATVKILGWIVLEMDWWTHFKERQGGCVQWRQHSKDWEIFSLWWNCYKMGLWLIYNSTFSHKECRLSTWMDDISHTSRTQFQIKRESSTHPPLFLSQDILHLGQMKTDLFVKKDVHINIYNVFIHKGYLS